MGVPIESLSGLKKELERKLTKGLLVAGKKFEPILIDKIYSEWYRRKGFASYGDITALYKRTWQLPKAVETRIADDNGVDIFINPDKLKPMLNPDSTMLNSYMSKDKSTSHDDKSISEWVVEWIEHGNTWWWMPPTEVHKQAEMDIERKNLAEKELVKELKNMGIDARRVY